MPAQISSDHLAELENSVFRYRPLKRFGHLVHGVSRRRSPDIMPDRELNLDFTSDDSSHALTHRELFCKAMGIELDKTVWFEPANASAVQMVGRESCGAGARDWSTRRTGTAGIATLDTDVFLATLVNDNVVVMLFEPRWYAVALVSVDPQTKNVDALGAAVDTLAAHGAQRREIIAVIAPSLGPCCYEFPDPALRGANIKTNMWDIARGALSSAGVRDARIHNARLCTSCKPFDFYSRHAGGAASGAGAAIIGISDENDFASLLVRRREHMAERRQRQAEDDSWVDEISLTIEEQRLNSMMKCPYGQKKVYIRSLLTGESTETGKPELALRCAAMQYVGQARGGYNIVDEAYIRKYCCNDPAQCPAYQELRRRQKK